MDNRTKTRMTLEHAIGALIRKYGQAIVTNEIKRQVNVARIATLTPTIGNTRVARIQLALRLGFADSLREAKWWVEANFDDQDNGPPCSERQDARAKAGL